MEFLIVSDIHADEYSKFASIDPSTKMNSRLYWTIDIFDQIVEFQEKTDCKKTLLVGGDVFDKRGVISTPTYDAVCTKIEKMVDSGWEIVGIVGNHDQATRVGEINALSHMPFTSLLNPYGTYVSKQGFCIGGVSFCERPQKFLENLVVIRDRKPDIYLVHQGVRGAKIAGDEILSREEIGSADIRSIVGDEPWIFSGHYHIHQNVDDKFAFVGSSTPKDFGDKTPKGFLYFKDNSFTQIESRAPKFISLEASELEETEDWKGNYLKVSYDTKEPPNIDSSEVLGYVLKQEIDSKKYKKRSSIEPEQSPMTIIGKYLEDMLEKGLLGEFDKEDALQILKEITGEKSIDQNFGGKSVAMVQLHMENFMSYKKATLDLTKFGGLVLIEGENKDDPSATSNGSGKSLIPEAIKWVLFGSTARGVRGDSVVNTTAGKDCMVRIEMMVEDEIIEVTRHRKHKKYGNELMLRKLGGDSIVDMRGKSDKETQEILEREIGTDENCFDNTVFFGHSFTKSFAALTDKNQKQILENTLGIEYFTDLFEKARELRTLESQKYSDIEVKKTWQEKRITDAESQISSSMETLQSFEKIKEEKISDLCEKLEEKADYLEKISDFKNEEDKLSKLVDRVQVYREALEDCKEKNSVYTEEIEQVREGLRNVQKEEMELEYEQRQEMNSLEIKARRLSELESAIENSICPSCKQNLANTKDLEAEESSLCKELIKLEEVVCQLTTKIETAKTGRVQIEETLQTLDKNIVDLDPFRINLENEREEKDCQEKKIEEIRRAVTYTKREIDDIQKSIAKLESEENPAEKQLKSAEDNLKSLRKEQKKLLRDCAETVKKFKLCKFWEYAFSDKGSSEQSPIKSYLLDSVVPVLDEISKVYSEILTDGSLEVRFNTVKELKSGELRDNFNVVVNNSYGAQEYLGDSGGEKRKVDLIIMFALHALARIRSGSRFDILFLDEILDSLDYEGCERVMYLLKEMEKEIKTIFVITHNQQLKTKFSSSLTVRKENSISCLLNH